MGRTIPRHRPRSQTCGIINSIKPGGRRTGKAVQKPGRKSATARRDFSPALKRGADELMNRVEWALRNDRKALRGARRVYRRCCADLDRILKSHFEGRS
jgi:hypothetical protein